MTKENNNRMPRNKALVGLLVTSLIVNLTIESQKVKAEVQNELSALESVRKRSIAQIIRQIVDLPQRVAAAGSRGIDKNRKDICLISPLISASMERITAYTTVQKPVIVTNTPLNEIIIKEADGIQKIILKKTASTLKPIKTPIYWPLESFPMGNKYILELRPRGAARAERIQILWMSSDDDIIKASEQAVETIYSSKEDSIEVLERLSSDSPELAIELIFNKKTEHLAGMKELQSRLIKYSCQGNQFKIDSNP